MKALKLLFLTLITGTMLTSCVRVDDTIIVDDYVSLEEVVSNYDLWYIDYHSTTGTGDVPYLSKAFTVSFINGRLYANNNIADIGITGNGLGIVVGEYNTYNGILETHHDLDGYFDFEVEINRRVSNEITIHDIHQNVSYHLIGYQRNNFDYDKLFYENIEYFLQEYIAWERTDTVGGTPNVFDEERYLQFTPENNTTFYSSSDSFGTNIELINWDFVGSYSVYDYTSANNVKLLTLYYDGGDKEEFELRVLNDQNIELYHINSGTTYVYTGKGFVQYLKSENALTAKPPVRNSGRKRTKIIRQKVDRKVLK
ncbi:hypothetical protein [Tenacibaculum sp. IB213877]|uniref:hypothetical protein n=1 Tax=Tenacibaculum sp. IB213877 TaxID=3097351 RepID=UPI002A5ACFD3|nr:hypothetical protein [Tenacibaculum sp. IB213877]MDY0780442.1 hypothetical protein [Tenacibaculum sp. IB213877]